MPSLPVLPKPSRTMKTWREDVVRQIHSNPPKPANHEPESTVPSSNAQLQHDIAASVRSVHDFEAAWHLLAARKFRLVRSAVLEVVLLPIWVAANALSNMEKGVSVNATHVVMYIVGSTLKADLLRQPSVNDVVDPDWEVAIVVNLDVMGGFTGDGGGGDAQIDKERTGDDDEHNCFLHHGGVG
ncbi:hypothetical protein E6O75_ATG05838 [Venturia nashicola]|uniref:Uncharacterized protein n=1 Tax=Venturia nashicola TaxID=86259 RepID=A0A4Z1NVQ3_9PEZI|nr:hypothetical protein E6O75_ATG05838 [Venturia nashicola]